MFVCVSVSAWRRESVVKAAKESEAHVLWCGGSNFYKGARTMANQHCLRGPLHKYFINMQQKYFFYLIDFFLHKKIHSMYKKI